MYFKVDSSTVPVPETSTKNLVENTEAKPTLVVPTINTEGGSNGSLRKSFRKSVIRNPQPLEATQVVPPQIETWTLAGPHVQEADDIKEEDTSNVHPLVLVSPIQDMLPRGSKTSLKNEQQPVVRMSVAIRENDENSALVVEAKVANVIEATKSMKKSAPPGIITRFNVPVPQNQLDAQLAVNQKDNRRSSLSYANVVSANCDKTIHDWLTMLQDEGRTPGKTQSHPIIEEPEEEKPTEDSPVETNGQVKPATEKNEVVVLRAVLLGTDSDYLEKSTFRTIFRENVLEAEDGKLFEMPPVLAPQQAEQPEQPSGPSWRCC